MTKVKPKAKSASLDLPAGWQWDKESSGWKAINPDKNLETTPRTTLKEAVAAAHRIDEKYGTDESADPVAERLHKEAIARWRREPGAMGDDAISTGYHPQMLRMIPVDQIAPSPTNPRKYFDEGKLQELADSIIEHGLVEPILVRPLRRTTTGAVIGGDIGETLNAWPGLAGKLYYEIVAGERRWRATKLAGLTEIEAKVRDLDDRAALEIQLIENLQREDVSPIEEADGYMAMLALKDETGASVYTVDSLAAKIGKKGKSKGYVYGRLKLRNLPPAALEAMAKGDLPTTIGELIGRLPSPALREKLWKASFSGIENDWFRMPSFRDIKATIDREYMRELKGAPFSQTDKKLVPAAGDCKNCPKRTGNNRVEYPDGRADICTDLICFKAKVEAFQKRQLKEAASDGVKVLSAQESVQILGYHGAVVWNRRNEWVSLAEECEEARPDQIPENEDNFDDTPAPTYGELLGQIKPDAVGMDGNGNLHRLVTKARAAEILRSKHGIEIEKPADDDEDDSFDRDGYLNEQKQRRESRKLAIERIADQVAGSYDAEFIHRFKSGYAKSPLPDLLRALVTPLLCGLDDDGAIFETYQRRNPNAEDPDDLPVEHMVSALLAGADAGGIVGTLAEVCIRQQLWGWPNDYREVSPTLLEFLGLNLADFEEQALNELAPVAEAEPKSKGKPKSKPKAKADATV